MLARKNLIKDKRSGPFSNLDRLIQEEENKKAKKHTGGLRVGSTPCLKINSYT